MSDPDPIVVEQMLISGSDPDTKGKFGRTPIFRCALEGYTKIARLLLNHGANVNLADDGGSSPLQTALLHENGDIVLLLIEHGARVEHKDNNHETALFYATNHFDIKLLIGLGSDIGIENDQGRSVFDSWLEESLGYKFLFWHQCKRWSDFLTLL